MDRQAGLGRGSRWIDVENGRVHHLMLSTGTVLFPIFTRTRNFPTWILFVSNIQNFSKGRFIDRFLGWLWVSMGPTYIRIHLWRKPTNNEGRLSCRLHWLWEEWFCFILFLSVEGGLQWNGTKELQGRVDRQALLESIRLVVVMEGGGDGFCFGLEKITGHHKKWRHLLYIHISCT